MNGNFPESYECRMQIAIKMLCMRQLGVMRCSSDMLHSQPKEKLLELLTYKTFGIIRDCDAQLRKQEEDLSAFIVAKVMTSLPRINHTKLHHEPISRYSQPCKS